MSSEVVKWFGDSEYVGITGKCSPAKLLHLENNLIVENYTEINF
jgi:hypothetical protein